MTATVADTTPRAWIGCLACYNAGRLVGRWFDAANAAEVTIYDIHGAHSRADSHDELWVMDHENIPVSGEMSPADAAAWGSALNEVEEHPRPALIAWAASGDYVTEGRSDLPCIPEFVDRYCGEWSDFDDYARGLADDTGLLDGVPEGIAKYFDWDDWTRDLAFDCTTADNPDGGVYVFRNL